MSEAEIWASVVQQDSSVTYQKFIDQFPNSKHLADAKEATEWLQAKEENTKRSISNYLLEKEPKSSGKYRSVALQALYAIEEHEHWEKASTEDTLNSYFEYLSKFKSGSHVDDASNRIQELLKDKDDLAFKKALEKDSLEAIQEYLENPGDKKYEQEAEKKVSAIAFELDETSREQSAWEIATNTGTYIGYQNFVQAYPASRFAEEASWKMKSMDDVAWKDIQFLEYDSSFSLGEKINRCITYFDNFPGAANNVNVKQIKDQFEFNRIDLDIQDLPKNVEPGPMIKIWASIKDDFRKMLRRK